MLLKNNKKIYRIERESEDEWRITDGEFPYRSKTYSQEKAYKAAGLSTDDIAAKEFQDIAYITKITNPFEGTTKILILAGVRGIGTWGAAECIKKTMAPDL